MSARKLSLPALDPHAVDARRGSTYPTKAFRERVAAREKRALGDALGLASFGVNLVRLEPGGWSSLRHWHLRQDEFVYVLEGEVTLVTDAGRQTLAAGDCAGFAAGVRDGHHMINESSRPAIYLEVGDRAAGDTAYYPDADLQAHARPSGYEFHHRDGASYADDR